MKTLEQLFAAWEDGTLTTADAAELKRHLADPKARAELVSELHLHGVIYEKLSQESLESSAQVVKRPVKRPVKSPVRSQPMRRPPHVSFWQQFLPHIIWRDVRVSLWLIAKTALIVGIALGAFYYFQENRSVAFIASGSSQFTIQRNGKQVTAQVGAPLYNDDLIQTGPKQTAIIGWPDEATRLQLEPQSELRIQYQSLRKHAALRQGQLSAKVSPQPARRPMIIQTPHADVKVVGTQFNLDVNPSHTRLDVYEGTVEMKYRFPQPPPPVLVHSGQTCAAKPESTSLAVHWLTGYATREVWDVPAGTDLADASAQGRLISRSSLSNMVSISPSRGKTDHFSSNDVVRIRGYILAPRSGDYIFYIGWLGSDIPAEFWFSPDENSTNKLRIASIPKTSVTPPPVRSNDMPTPWRDNASGVIKWMYPREFYWVKSPEQQSQPQRLEANRRYYFEVVHRDCKSDYLAVGWLQPGESNTSQPRVIPCANICPPSK